jgi:hypothetical protein
MAVAPEIRASAAINNSDVHKYEYRLGIRSH